jgi:hypothetical protein
MEKVILDYLNQIPLFLSNLINLIGAPTSSLLNYLKVDSNSFKCALLFFGISSLVSIIIKMPFLSPDINLIKFLQGDVIWKFILMISESFFIYLSWKIWNVQLTLFKCIIATLYIFSVLFILIPLLFVLFQSIEKQMLVPIDRYAFVFSFFILLFYSIKTWAAFRKNLAAGIIKSVISYSIMFVLSVFSFALGIIFRTSYVEYKNDNKAVNEYTDFTIREIIEAVPF